MQERSVLHSTFTIERTYATSPARVFAAWSEPDIKRRWFGGGSDSVAAALQLDFKVGGQETIRGVGPNGMVHEYDARYCDIVPDQRIVYSYQMFMDGTLISVSVGTVELRPEGGATQLVYTEQGAFLDGLDTPAQREHGTRELLDALGVLLARAATRA